MGNSIFNSIQSDFVLSNLLSSFISFRCCFLRYLKEIFLFFSITTQNIYCDKWQTYCDEKRVASKVTFFIIKYPTLPQLSLSCFTLRGVYQIKAKNQFASHQQSLPIYIFFNVNIFYTAQSSLMNHYCVRVNFLLSPSTCNYRI